MSNIFFIFDAVNTPLSEEQTKNCIALHETCNQNDMQLNNEIHVTETVKGHVAIINKKLASKAFNNKCSLNIGQVDQKYNIRWLDIKSEYIMFGLKAS